MLLVCLILKLSYLVLKWNFGRMGGIWKCVGTMWQEVSAGGCLFNSHWYANFSSSTSSVGHLCCTLIFASDGTFMEIGPLVSCESNINRWILRICDIKLVCIFHVADLLDLATKKVCLIAFPCRLFLLAPLYEYASWMNTISDEVLNLFRGTVVISCYVMWDIHCCYCICEHLVEVPDIELWMSSWTFSPMNL